MTVRATTRTKTQRSVWTEVGKHPRIETKSHILVKDLIEFATHLGAANAPLDESVKIVLVAGTTGLARIMRVDWVEDLIDGQPAPQAEPVTIPGPGKGEAK